MDLTKITPKTFPKYQGHPVLKGLSKHLKDPANYDKIRRAILDTLATGHSHSELYQYVNCKLCSSKMLERRLLLRKLGFKSPAQYMAWQAVHHAITQVRRDPIK